MRIAFIGQKGIDIGEKGGGIEQHVSALSKQLAARGHEVTIYSRRRYCDDRPRTQDTIRVRCIPTVYRKNLETIVHTFLCTFDALFKPFDIIHYHGVGPATLAWIPRLFKPHCRVVVTFHSQDRFHQKWGWLARHYLHLGEWAACWFPHATVAVSHVIQVYARRYYRRQVVYIPNGAVVQHITATGEVTRLGLEPGRYILNVSRLVPHKGQHYLIEAFQKLEAGSWKSGTEIKLVLVGAPAYTKEYEQKLKALAAGNPDILFLGHQSGETLRQLFAHAYLYVQPSESEGLALVVLEAMSFGTSVLVSDIPENLEAMHHAGFSFKNTDVDDLAAQLAQLLNHPEVVSASAEKAQDVIETHFNWSVIAERTEMLYRSLRH